MSRLEFSATKTEGSNEDAEVTVLFGAVPTLPKINSFNMKHFGTESAEQIKEQEHET